MPQALFVVPDPQAIAAARQLTETWGFTTYMTQTLQEVQQLSDHIMPEIVFVDTELADGSGLRLLKTHHWGAATQFLVMASKTSLELVIQALRLSARDIFLPPLNLTEFNDALTRIIHARGMYRQPTKKLTVPNGGFGRLMGTSMPMQQLYTMIERVAPTNATVLISGESGTEKELVAQTLHDYSLRSNNPFVTVNCGAIAANLIDSELFGSDETHVSVAQKPQKGYFEQASCGTLFLDELTETSSELQARLLRVLETNTVIPVGSKRQLTVNTRVIAAINLVHENTVKTKSLREDLYYRLNTFPINIPPLRERGSDISLLATSFLKQLNHENKQQKTLHPRALTLLQTWPWPGNVRELKNVMHRAYILADSQIEAEHISFSPSLNDIENQLKLRVDIGTALSSVEQQFITKLWPNNTKNLHATIQSFSNEQSALTQLLKSYPPASLERQQEGDA